jgi:hypothetical protein
MAGRGWAWTAYDWDEGRLFNYVGDAQNTFPIWNATPLIALDVYEHAYFLDTGPIRASYIDAFFDNLDWSTSTTGCRSTRSRRSDDGSARPLREDEVRGFLDALHEEYVQELVEDASLSWEEAEGEGDDRPRRPLSGRESKPDQPHVRGGA